MKTLSDIRSTFLDFFKKLDHTIVPSSPLVPNDPTLLFTAAGMVPFKDIFTGKEKRDYTRAASSQKCLRAGGKHNDLDQVGYTARHHTFFEMLGNFSFGDYFKEDAIAWSFELLTKNFGLQKDKLLITVYHTDDEAYNLWKKWMPEEKIIRIDTNDNFWSMGDTGPCGPCSEIFYDYGDHIPGGPPGSKDSELDRFVEVWNLVFMQYETLPSGERINLPSPSIDTGMGLERIGSVLQGKTNNYDTDLFLSTTQASQELFKQNDPIVSHRVIADHLRSSSFLIADGVLPSNEGRGYVLRRILRRAMRHTHHLGNKEPNLYKLVDTLTNSMGQAYPELKRAEALIASTLKQEEEKFLTLLDRGLGILNEETKELKPGGTLTGSVAFKLYDTYGFPIDLTQDLLRSRQINVDEAGFKEAMEEQRTLSRSSWAGTGDAETESLWFDFPPTPFQGYSTLELNCEIKAIIKDNQTETSLNSGQEGWVILSETPFYATAGGQVADIGSITTPNATAFVRDVLKKGQGVFAHFVSLQSGTIRVGDSVQATVDKTNRQRTAAHHSATHLLHHALRKELGDHVAQKGSLVEANRLRFDFTHAQALNQTELANIESLVNQAIMANDSQVLLETTPDEAFEKGAIGLFGEKYGDKVRVVQLGDSNELCGGTHVSATGQIGLFKILSESSIGSGVRRIEALCGLALAEYINELQQKNLDLQQELREQKKKKASSNTQPQFTKLANISTKDGTPILLEEGEDLAQFRGRVDELRKSNPNSLFFIYNKLNEKVSFVIGVSEGLPFKAPELALNISKVLGGKGGGGKPTLAQGGGTEPSALPQVFEYLENLSA